MNRIRPEPSLIDPLLSVAESRSRGVDRSSAEHWPRSLLALPPCTTNQTTPIRCWFGCTDRAKTSINCGGSCRQSACGNYVAVAPRGTVVASAA